MISSPEPQAYCADHGHPLAPRLSSDSLQGRQVLLFRLQLFSIDDAAVHSTSNDEIDGRVEEQKSRIESVTSTYVSLDFMKSSALFIDVAYYTDLRLVSGLKLLVLRDMSRTKGIRRWRHARDSAISRTRRSSKSRF
jgi:hypothetical protein